MLTRTRGLVTKAVNFGEGDKILTLLSDRFGKIQVMAKGARRTKSKLMAGTQLFCYGDFVLFKGKSWYYMNEVDIINTFHRIRNDLIKLCSCTYLIELANAVVQPEEPPGRLLDVLVDSLDMFTEGGTDSNILTRAAELKILALSGFKPRLGHCTNCGANRASSYFSPVSGGILCGECEKTDPYGYRISPDTIEVMKVMLKWKLGKLDCIKVKGHILKELEKIMRAFVAVHIEKNFSANKFLDNIKKYDK
jgi:DNA repair protein RecO (recombination protein O)